MSKTPNQDYEKILENLAQQLNHNFIKTSLNFMLIIYWTIILLGTFLMLN